MPAEYIKDRGRREGVLSMAQEDVVEVLNTKFSSVPVEIVEKINGTTDLVELKKMLKQGVLANSLSDFIKIVKN